MVGIGRIKDVAVLAAIGIVALTAWRVGPKVVDSLQGALSSAGSVVSQAGGDLGSGLRGITGAFKDFGQGVRTTSGESAYKDWLAGKGEQGCAFCHDNPQFGYLESCKKCGPPPAAVPVPSAAFPELPPAVTPAPTVPPAIPPSPPPLPPPPPAAPPANVPFEWPVIIPEAFGEPNPTPPEQQGPVPPVTDTTGAGGIPVFGGASLPPAPPPSQPEIQGPTPPVTGTTGSAGIPYFGRPPPPPRPNDRIIPVEPRPTAYEPPEVAQPTPFTSAADYYASVGQPNPFAGWGTDEVITTDVSVANSNAAQTSSTPLQAYNEWMNTSQPVNSTPAVPHVTTSTPVEPPNPTYVPDLGIYIDIPREGNWAVEDDGSITAVATNLPSRPTYEDRRLLFSSDERRRRRQQRPQSWRSYNFDTNQYEWYYLVDGERVWIGDAAAHARWKNEYNS